MGRAFLLFVCLALSHAAFAQVVQQKWAKTITNSVIGGQFVTIEDQDEISYVATRTNFNTDVNNWSITKYFYDGSVAGGSSLSVDDDEDHSFIRASVSTPNGFYVAGYFGSSQFGLSSNTLAVLSSKGDKATFRANNLSTSASGIASDTLGNIYVVGSTSNGQAGAVVLLKYTKDLELSWSRVIENDPNDTFSGRRIAVNKTGQIYIGATYYDFENPEGGFASVLMKLSTFGHELWRRTTADLSSMNVPADVELDGGGNPYIYNISSSSTASRAVLKKYDIAGNLQWSRAYTLAVPDGAAREEMVITKEGAFICGSAVVDGVDKGYVRGWDSQGALKWSSYADLILGSKPSAIRGLAADKYGQIYACGTAGTGTGTQYILLKFNPADGGVRWAMRYNGSANAGDHAYDVSVNSHGDILVTGESSGAADNRCHTVRYNQGPVGQADTYYVERNTTMAIDSYGVLANDWYTGISPSGTLVSPPGNGVVSFNGDGSFTYTPNTDFVGTDTFTYRGSRHGLQGSTATVSLIVAPRVSLTNFTINPSTIVSGTSTNGTVTLSAKSPHPSTSVQVTDNSTAVNAPSVATVSGGAQTSVFAIGTNKVSSTVTRQVTATFDAVSKIANLTLEPASAALQSLELGTPVVTAGDDTSATVKLDLAAPAGGATVAISDNSSSITTPSSVSVTAGAVSATFLVETAAVTQSSVRTITASYLGVNKSAIITINPASALTSLSLNPSSVKGGQSTTATVTISFPAPAGGISVALADNSSAITTPSTVAVPQGATSAQVTVQTGNVSTTYTRSITATYKGVSKTANLTLTP